MKDLKDMCLIEKNTLTALHAYACKYADALDNGDIEDQAGHYFTENIHEQCDIAEQAINQDLSGMVVVPLTPTKDMLEAMDEAGMMDSFYYPDVYKAVLSAAQKEKNDD